LWDNPFKIRQICFRWDIYLLKSQQHTVHRFWKLARANLAGLEKHSANSKAMDM
jgi:hypothetical protein